MVENEKNKMEEYIAALEDELLASIEREEKNAITDLGFKEFTIKKIKKSKFYTNIASDPNSRMGKVVRGPRSVYRIIKNPEVRKNLIQKKTLNKTSGNLTKSVLEPWVISLFERKRIATKALGDGKKLALYFVEKPDSSTFRYRCFNTFEATKGSEKWQAVYFFKNELETLKELLPKSSILVFGRQSGQEKVVKELIRIAHTHNIKAGLDIDDLVFDMKYLDVMLDAIGEKINRSYWISYFASVQAMAKQMDFFITTNKYLEDKLKISYDKPCAIITNSLNTEQIIASKVYVKYKNNDDGIFKIGYFSGSPTHTKDFGVAEPEVLKFLKNHRDAIFYIVGYMRFSKSAQKLIDEKRIVFLPMVDFRKLQKLMAEMDVNIAPLQINDFTNCKSELKFFEAAIVKTTTIASPIYAFKHAIKDGDNGFLAEPNEWYDKLEYLFDNSEINHKIAERAYAYALKNYYGEKFLKEVESVYDLFVE